MHTTEKDEFITVLKDANKKLADFAREKEADASRMRHHLTELAKLADRAALVLATLEAENSDEEEQIQQIIDGISTWAPPAMLGDVQAA